MRAVAPGGSLVAITQRGRHRFRPMDPIWKMSAAVQHRSSDEMDIRPSLASGDKSGGRPGFNLRWEVDGGVTQQTAYLLCLV